MASLLQFLSLAVVAVGAFVQFGVGVGLLTVGGLGFVSGIVYELDQKKDD